MLSAISNTVYNSAEAAFEESDGCALDKARSDFADLASEREQYPDDQWVAKRFNSAANWLAAMEMHGGDDDKAYAAIIHSKNFETHGLARGGENNGVRFEAAVSAAPFVDSDFFMASDQCDTFVGYDFVNARIVIFSSRAEWEKYLENVNESIAQSRANKEQKLAVAVRASMGHGVLQEGRSKKIYYTTTVKASIDHCPLQDGGIQRIHHTTAKAKLQEPLPRSVGVLFDNVIYKTTTSAFLVGKPTTFNEEAAILTEPPTYWTSSVKLDDLRTVELSKEYTPSKVEVKTQLPSAATPPLEHTPASFEVGATYVVNSSGNLVLQGPPPKHLSKKKDVRQEGAISGKKTAPSCVGFIATFTTMTGAEGYSSFFPHKRTPQIITGPQAWHNDYLTPDVSKPIALHCVGATYQLEVGSFTTAQFNDENCRVHDLVLILDKLPPSLSAMLKTIKLISSSHWLSDLTISPRVGDRCCSVEINKDYIQSTNFGTCTVSSSDPEVLEHDISIHQPGSTSGEGKSHSLIFVERGKSGFHLFGPNMGFKPSTSSNVALRTRCNIPRLSSLFQ